jgi:hypothetical protein
MPRASLSSISPLETPEDVAQALRALVSSAALELPFPGSGHGQTQARFEALAEIATVDLSLARLAEGHADARAILAEAGRAPVPNEHSYGVWAAEPPDARVVAE